MTSSKLHSFNAGKLLRKGRKTLAIAESCTGGLLGALLTDIPGSSDYFLGGITAYHNRIKTSLLGVPKTLLLRHGAVSAPAAKAMAKNVRRIFGSDYGIALTGIAGPGGGSTKKPVGLVYIAIAGNKKIFCKKFLFSGSRIDIKSQAVRSALELLERVENNS